MKKITSIIIGLIFLCGCTSTNTAANVVEDYLSSYQNLEYQVLVDMEEVVNAEDSMNDEQKEIYRQILKKQYEDFTYEIISESYNEDDAVVEVVISVYDYYEASTKASEYLKNNSDEFYNEDNEYDSSLYMDYKLRIYQITTTKLEYTIYLNLVNEDGVWKLLTVSNDTLEKIHGIYNYDLN